MMLALRDIACLRGDRLLFERLSLELAAGDALVVTGANGVGKSSLLRIAAGLLRPSAGTIERPGRVAWLGEASALDGDRTLGQALDFWAKLDGTRPDAAMAQMGIAHLVRVPVRYLSTGQRRRAAIARTIASGAPLWLLDEPANGLDAEGIERLGDAIRAHRRTGGSVFTATHLPLPIDDAATLMLDGAIA
ncbi:heme ABC exporter ATP-binding protein CcmA [Sphingomonas sp. CGMCC 1.13654]|uniref:Heme ABC exporter ATP-binding protein CcmA n=1 Tax=Sphingomonas chungangi TaxID=2683589 RepID=A0A838L995_9SPHN|nr:heme ABC exporter ATP-binding protein CcmA [Sphingomonas chungangi]MBA2934706.1 heme ABC exporter ATP-binding protein CcmA [Sphingomonas chungangi]MVW58017.1 heme ABC exporter ATP-binding protein CcmA [Sphingomonas chungangi]